MIYAIIFFILWYISGLVSLAWAVKFSKKKIMDQLFPYLMGAMFGLLITLLVIFDGFVEKSEKND